MATKRRLTSRQREKSRQLRSSSSRGAEEKTDYQRGFDEGFESATRKYERLGLFEESEIERDLFRSPSGRLSSRSRHAELERAEGLRSQLERAPSRVVRGLSSGREREKREREEGVLYKGGRLGRFRGRNR